MGVGLILEPTLMRRRRAARRGYWTDLIEAGVQRDNQDEIGPSIKMRGLAGW